MARVSAAGLRDLAREAMLSAGGRGFMRFAPAGDALLITDAPRRCDAQEAARMALLGALDAAGFACCEAAGLLGLTPCDALLIGEAIPPVIDWDSDLHPAQALAARWLRCDAQELTAAGRRLVIEALRLTWQPRGKVLQGLPALRAQAAVCMREHDRSGLRAAGAVLAAWCEEEMR